MILGIDVGINGGFAFLDDNGKPKHLIVSPKVGKLMDLQAISMIIKSCKSWDEETHVFIELIHAMHLVSAKSTFGFGFAFCAPQMACVCHGLKYTLVTPKEWQKEMHQGVPMMRKPSVIISRGARKGTSRKGARDAKAMSLVAAKRLFPGTDLRRTPACTIDHDGLVDALLIAAYGRRLLART